MRPRYTWDATAHLDEVAPAIMPHWLLTVVTARERDTLSRDGTPLVLRKGERNWRLFQLGSAQRRYGVGAEVIRESLEAVNRAHCVPPLDADEVAKIAASAARYAPAARCDPCGAPLPEDGARAAAGLDEDALMAGALGVVR
jgi:Primase C terminal 1 (PriCT-1)